jgi:hypothetical protein
MIHGGENCGTFVVTNFGHGQSRRFLVTAGHDEYAVVSSTVDHYIPRGKKRIVDREIVWIVRIARDGTGLDFS